MSNFIKPSNLGVNVIKEFGFDDMEGAEGIVQNRIDSVVAFEGAIPDGKEGLDKKKFVLDLTGKIKTDDERIAELEKKHLGEIEARARKFYKDERERGLKEGMNTGLSALAPTVDAFKKLTIELHGLRERFYNQIEKEVLSMILSVSKAVIAHEVTVNKNVILNAIKSALKKGIEHESIKIRVNSEDIDYVKKCRDDIDSFSGSMKNIEFMEDSSVKRGGYILETNFCEIDFSVEDNLARIEEKMKEAMQGKG